MKKENMNHLDYEQILLGERSIADYDRLEFDKMKLQKIEQSNEEILKKYSPEQMAASITKKLDSESIISKGTFYQRRMYIPLSAAAVFLLIFVLIPTYKNSFQTAMPYQAETIRLKGNAPSLYIYKANASDTELLSNNSLVREKDLLQISYDGAGDKYGVIFSIDGRGAVNLHFPDNIYSNTRLDFGGKVYLPFSYELDNAPFFERFFFITSLNEIDASQILEKAGRIAKGNKSEMLNLSEEYKQQSIILLKEGK